MVGHAECFAPAGITASAGVVMATFGAHDAQVTLGQLGHARVAVTLAETGFGLAAAMAAMNGTQVFQAHVGADQRVDRHLGVAQTKRVLNGRLTELRRHFADCTATDFNQWIASDLNRMFGTGADLDAHSCGPM